VSRNYVILLAFITLLVLFFPARHVEAEPYLAVRAGQKCSACHVNPTGGGMRKSEVCKFCRIEMIYSWRDLQEDGERPEPEFSGQFNAFVALGGDFRASYRYSGIPGQANTSEFEAARGQLYLSAALLPGRVLLYLDQQVLPGGALTREGFALVRGLPWEGYLKAGKIFLPFGYRLQDETAFVRSAPQYTMANADHGLELGFQPGPLSLALAVTNGTAGGAEDNAGKQITFSGALVGEFARAGISFASNRDGAGDLREAASIFGGMGLGPLALLFEAVTVTDMLAAGAETVQRALLAEVNWWVGTGASLKLTQEWHDPDTSADGDERTRSSLVFEPFLLPHTQVRTGIRVNDSDSGVAAQNTDDFFLELHLFF
jgi:hypothetical protein